ncbi:MAG: nitroreductase, partial [Sphingomonadales bacterium]
MTVTEALQRRQATRAFLDRPVPGTLLETLIEQASQSPSGGNLQPWHVHALTGASLEQLKATVRDKLDRGEREAEQYAIYPSDLWEPLRGRRREAGAQRYAALGISREMDGQAVLERMNFEFFGAPIGLFFAIDRRCGPPQWADLGMFMQSLMLLAVEHGLASCPQEVWSVWPETVARHVGLSDDLILFAGMALG